MASGGSARALDIRASLKEALARMRAANVPSAPLAAELLLMHTLGRDRAWVYAHPEEPLDAAARERFFELVARRAAGTPTQYLTERQEFWGLEFEVNPDVLIPRPETEHVVEVALARLGQQKSRSPLRIADVGTGSGCLATALAHELPTAVVFVTDISAAALAVARRNAVRHGVAGRIHFAQCDLLDAFSQVSGAASPGARTFDLIVSNPPYIGRNQGSELPREVREHEPRSAFFGGDRGDEIYGPLLDQAAPRLICGGIIALELGYGASERVRALVDRAGCWRDVSITNDLAGIPRVLAAERR